MKDILELLLHFVIVIFTLLKPSGVKRVMADTMVMKQQLIALNRNKKRSPQLTSSDRFIFGLLAFFIDKNRLKKVSVIIQPATILRFHKALVNKKYQILYSRKTKNKPGRKGPGQAIINAVIEMKKRNPKFGYLRIAMQIYQAFGITLSPYAVRRILQKNKTNFPAGDGPSWLTFIGNMKDSLWSVDLFRCESINLKTHWVMIVIDQYSRRIVGFAVRVGQCDGTTYCCMFNEILSGKSPPKYLSTDNDPLFRFIRWKANLRILEVDEIKTLPYTPVSHPFVERVIGTVRRECLDHTLFFNERDLQKKLNHFQKYYNESRGHSSLDYETPKVMASETNNGKKSISIEDYFWKSFNNGLVKLPVLV